MQLPKGLSYELHPPYSASAEILSQIPDDELHHQQADLLHPLAILNRATLPVLDSLEGVLEELEGVERAWDNGEDLEWGNACRRLLIFQDQLLHALFEFIDLSYLVLIGLHPSAAPRTSPKQFNYQWLDSIDTGLREEYWDQIKPVHEDLGRIVNGMKHRGLTLAPLVFESPACLVPGYYHQGLTWSGGLGPEAVIHPAKTAFSFNRDVRLRVLQWICVDAELGTKIKEVVNDHDMSLGSVDEERCVHRERWGLFEKAASLGVEVFPDERRKRFPLLLIEEDSGESVVKASARDNVGLPLGKGKFRFTASGDGVTTHGSLPYLSGQNESSWDLEATM